MLTDFLLFFTGLFLLYLGAELLVRGSAQMAVMARISPLIVGITVVALGTSSPEIIVSFIAALSDMPDVAIGNIIGSNIANIGLILGVSALIKLIPIKKTTINREVYYMLAVSLAFWFFAYTDYNLSRIEGILFLALLIMFILYSIREGRKNRIHVPGADEIPIDKKLQKMSNPVKIIIFIIEIVAGIIVLVYGSDVTIDSAVNIARTFGISEVVIGLTLVAFGTSLPELATAVISVIKKENEILIGNIIGSNLFNILLVGGGVASVFEIAINQRVVFFDIPVMLLFGLVLLPVILFWNRLSRIYGAFILSAYLGYIFFIFFSL